MHRERKIFLLPSILHEIDKKTVKTKSSWGSMCRALKIGHRFKADASLDDRKCGTKTNEGTRRMNQTQPSYVTLNSYRMRPCKTKKLGEIPPTENNKTTVSKYTFIDTHRNQII